MHPTNPPTYLPTYLYTYRESLHEVFGNPQALINHPQYGLLCELATEGIRCPDCIIDHPEMHKVFAAVGIHTCRLENDAALYLKVDLNVDITLIQKMVWALYALQGTNFVYTQHPPGLLPFAGMYCRRRTLLGM